QTTTYTVTIIETATGCRDIDTVTVTVNPKPTVDLAPGSTVCFTGTTTLDAGSGFTSYLWSPGNENTQTITVTQGGIYSVTVTNAFGCGGSDTVNLVLSPPPVVNLGPDRTACDGDTIIFNAGSGFDTYEWSNGTFDSLIVVGV